MSAYNVRLYDYKHSQQLRIYTKAVNQQSEDDKKADVDIEKEVFIHGLYVTATLDVVYLVL